MMAPHEIKLCLFSSRSGHFTMVKMLTSVFPFLDGGNRFCVVANRGRIFRVCDFGCTHFFIVGVLKMKRILLYTVSIVMLFSLCACANKQKAEKYCSSCGEGISKNATFCEHCGVPTNDIITDINNNDELVSEIECPKFVGQTIEEIKKNTEYTDNFEFEEFWESNEDYDYGYVYEQSVLDGEKIKKDTKINLYISMGKAIKKVPDVYGKSESAAVLELKSNGFDVVILEEPSGDVEEGLVIRTEPLRTTIVTEGEKITVVISSGNSK